MKFELIGTNSGQTIETECDLDIKDRTGKTSFVVGMRGDNLIVGTYSRSMTIKPNSCNSITVISGDR